jgi:predicted HTH domain antitoxin
VQLTLPAEIEQQLNPEEARLALALGLYVSGRLGMGRAAEVSGMSRMAFQRAMARQRIPVDYTLDDLRDDVAALNERDK